MDSASTQPGGGSAAGRQPLHAMCIPSLLNPVQEAARVERNPAAAPPFTQMSSPSNSFTREPTGAVSVSRITRPVVLTPPHSISNPYNNARTLISPQSERASTSPDGGVNKYGIRAVRPPRPSYSEEQKFFIMYARIMRDHTWPEIEDQFAALWERRSKGGLTSVYYRVRRDWGMMEVLKGGPDSFAGDCNEVEHRAKNFSMTFLRQIRYPL